jgi:hypothetical protein
VGGGAHPRASWPLPAQRRSSMRWPPPSATSPRPAPAPRPSATSSARSASIWPSTSAASTTTTFVVTPRHRQRRRRGCRPQPRRHAPRRPWNAVEPRPSRARPPSSLHPAQRPVGSIRGPSRWSTATPRCCANPYANSRRTSEGRLTVQFGICTQRGLTGRGVHTP